jgi:hypothetical protein
VGLAWLLAFVTRVNNKLVKDTLIKDLPIPTLHERGPGKAAHRKVLVSTHKQSERR